jgi:hypothetical protein
MELARSLGGLAGGLPRGRPGAGRVRRPPIHCYACSVCETPLTGCRLAEGALCRHMRAQTLGPGNTAVLPSAAPPPPAPLEPPPGRRAPRVQGASPGGTPGLRAAGAHGAAAEGEGRGRAARRAGQLTRRHSRGGPKARASRRCRMHGWAHRPPPLTGGPPPTPTLPRSCWASMPRQRAPSPCGSRRC